MRAFALWRCGIVLLPFALGACGGAQMLKADKEPAVQKGESMMVFMRATYFGGAISASVFDVTGPENKFIGIVNAGTKVGYPLKPGQYTFMVVSESADFMQATVLPDKTYYALVTPRMGVWKARFSFRPVRQGDGEFNSWNSATHFVVNTPETTGWANSNSVDIASKRNQYWPQWANKGAADRAEQTLNAEDGR